MVVLLPPPIRTAISFSIRIFHSDVRVAWADSRKRIFGGQVALFSRGSGECRAVTDRGFFSLPALWRGASYCSGRKLMKPIGELTGRRRRFLNGFRLAGELDF